MTTTIATAAIMTDRKQVMRMAEFSLVESQPSSDAERIIAGRLRFPPGCARDAIREIIALLLERETAIISQQCIGDVKFTTGWSTLIFTARLKTYLQLSNVARPSNLSVVRESTQKLIQELKNLVKTQPESTFEKLETESTVVDETEVETQAEIEEWLVISPTKAQDKSEVDEKTVVAEIEANASEVENLEAVENITYATAEQLQSLTLTKLKELASKHNIQGRSALTKNLDTAHQLLVPKLVELVTAAEI